MHLFEIIDQNEPDPLSWTTDPEYVEDRYTPTSDDFVILDVNIKDVFKHMHKDVQFDLSNPMGGDNAKAFRIHHALQHFAKKQPMDLAVLAWDEYNQGTDITNGRHRLFTAHKLGHKYAPAFVWKNTLDDFKKHVNTRPHQRSEKLKRYQHE